MSTIKSRQIKAKVTKDRQQDHTKGRQTHTTSPLTNKSKSHALRRQKTGEGSIPTRDGKESSSSRKRKHSENEKESTKKSKPLRPGRSQKKNQSSENAEPHQVVTPSIDDREELSQSSRESESVRDQNSSLGCYDDTDDCQSTASRRSDCSNSGRSSLPVEDGLESESKVEEDSDSVCTTPRHSRTRKKSPDSLERKRRRNVSSQSEDSSIESQRRATMHQIVQTRNGIIFKIGERLEAMDFQDKWYAAKIIDVDNDVNEILIHFERWNSRYDEWVPMDSPRLRPATHPYTRRDMQAAKKQKIIAEFKVGEAVLARWTDCKMYQAKIKEILTDGYYTVIFYDGFQRKLHGMNIHKTTAENKSKYEKMKPPDVGSSGGRSENSCSSSSRAEFSVAPKEFVIEEDHNRFKCPEKNCGKGFRKELLLLSHVKHYHSNSSSPTTASRRNRMESESMSSLDRSDTEASASRESVELDPPVQVPKCQSPTPSKASSPSDAGNFPKSEVDATICEVKKELATTPPEQPQQQQQSPPAVEVKVAQPTRLLKKIYPVTKMETRHAKLCFFKEDFSYLKEAKYLKSSGHKGEAIGSPQKDVGKPKKSLKAKDGESEERKNTPKKLLLPKVVKTELQEVVTNEANIKEESSDTQPLDKEPNAKKNFSSSDKPPADDEMVRCICECNDENGLMIQCEVCMTWQHGDCFNIQDVEHVPEKYVCYMCVEPAGLRKSFRYRYDQDWFEKGQLASFGPSTPSQSEAVLTTHNLTASVHGIMKVLHSLQHKLNLLQSENSPELRYWSKPWTQSDAAVRMRKKNVSEGPEKMEVAAEGSADPCKAFATAFDHSYFSPKQESVVALMSGPLQVAAEAVVVTSDLDASVGEEEVPNAVALDHGYAEEVACELHEPDADTCSSNLTDHVRSVQCEMSSQLDAIEEMLDFLEAEDSPQGAGDPDDFPELMKSVRSLSQDLGTVRKFARHRTSRLSSSQ